MLCLPLLVGSLVGVPMRPDQIEELMLRMNQPKIVHVIPDDSENGDDTVKEVPGTTSS
jgi:hypothetical protein